MLARAFQAVGLGGEEIWGRPPIYLREGGSIPIIAEIKRVTGLDSVMLGLSMAEDNLHAPNESYHLGVMRRGVETIAKILAAVAARPAVTALTTTKSTRRSLAMSASSAFFFASSLPLERVSSLSRDAERDEILLHLVCAVVAEAQVVLGGAPPVAMAFQDKAVLGVLVEVVLRSLKLCAFALLDVETVKVKVHGLQGPAKLAVRIETRVAGLQSRVLVGGRRNLARVERSRAALRAHQRRAGFRAHRLLGAAGKEYRGGAY